MIYFFTGKPGGGKSLHSAKFVDMYHKKGKHVITNFEIDTNWWQSHHRHVKNNKLSGEKPMLINLSNDELTTDYFIDFAEKYHRCNKKGKIIEKQTLIVIDECADIWSSRSWNKKGRQEWLNFFRQHRKFGYTVILIAQDMNDVDKQLRHLPEHVYEHRNVKNFKVFGQILALLFGGNFIVIPVKWTANGKKDHTEFMFCGKKYYSMYDSYKIFDMDSIRQNKTT